MQYMILFYYYTFNRLETRVYDILNTSLKKNKKTKTKGHIQCLVKLVEVPMEISVETEAQHF